MIEMEMENERVERLRLQLLGEEWIRIVTEGRLDRLAGFCNPDVASRLLLPKRIVTLDRVEDLVARYDDWFGACTDFQVEGSRVERVGPRLGIFYRFLLRKDGDWHRIEQQLYCTLQDGRVQRLDLLCSGFQIVAAGSEPAPALEAAEHAPASQSLL